MRILMAAGNLWGFRRGHVRLLDLFGSACASGPKRLAVTLRGAPVTLEVPLDEHCGRTLALFRETDEPLYRFLREALSGSDKAVVLDIGANLGSMGLRLAREFGAEAHLFEPQPDLAALLRDNTKRNRLQASVTIHEMALGVEDGAISLIANTANSGNAKVRRDALGPSVAMRRLDHVIDEATWKRCVVAKIDVEGFEPEVLAGASGLFASHRPVLVFELNRLELRDRGIDPGALADLLRSFGYEEFSVLGDALSPVERGVRPLENIVASTLNDRALLDRYGRTDVPPRGNSTWPVEQIRF